MNIRKYFILKNYRNHISDILSRKSKVTYSQFGEDMMMRYVLSKIGIDKPSYLDIGTNYPKYDNNTYLFYSIGGHGVCIEPDPELFKIICKARKRDICLNIGIGISSVKEADYYMMTSKSLNTFSKVQAEQYVKDQNYGRQRIERIIKVPLVTVNSIMERYLPSDLDILSIDTEGYDLDILKSLDLKRFRPKMICAETARFESKGKIVKVHEIGEHLEKEGYALYADTFYNSIFIDKACGKSVMFNL